MSLLEQLDQDLRAAMPRLQGKADGKIVNELARALLSSPV